MATIMLTLDGSPFAEQAIPHALGRLGPKDELFLVQAVDPAPALMAPETFLAEVDITGPQEYLETMARRLRARDVKVRTSLRLGFAREIIVDLATEEGVSLIVMASHGRTGPQRWLLGSVAESVMRHAPCPVWLVRCRTSAEPWDESPVPVKRVLIPLDASERADEAIDFVHRHLTPETVSLMLLSASNLAWVSHTESCGQMVAELRSSLEERAEKLRAGGWQVEVALDPGAPAEAILDTATEWGADLIAMTSHGRTGAERWFLGSVAEKVVRHSTCPVAVVRLAPSKVPALSGKTGDESRET